MTNDYTRHKIKKESKKKHNIISFFIKQIGCNEKVSIVFWSTLRIVTIAARSLQNLTTTKLFHGPKNILCILSLPIVTCAWGVPPACRRSAGKPHYM